jgi:hypothetical protein
MILVFTVFIGLGLLLSRGPGIEESLQEESSLFELSRVSVDTPSDIHTPETMSSDPKAQLGSGRGLGVGSIPSTPATPSAGVHLSALPATPVSTPKPTVVSLAKKHKSLNATASSEELLRISLGAAVPRGEVLKNGHVGSRLASYESKRKGPRRTDGKAWKAGEAGCPEKPKYESLASGGPLVQGDQRLKRIHFVHPPKV